VGQFVQDPRPIVFGIGVLAGVLSRWDCMGQRQSICRRNTPPKVTGIRSRIARVFDSDGIRRIVLAIPASGGSGCSPCRRDLRQRESQAV
jgi:hypothetical protein